MPELDDRATDRLFQTGAERHDYSYNPAAWEQMETMLDADRRRRSAVWYWVAGAVLLLALIGLAVTFYGGERTELPANDATDRQETPALQNNAGVSLTDEVGGQPTDKSGEKKPTEDGFTTAETKSTPRTTAPTPKKETESRVGRYQPDNPTSSVQKNQAIPPAAPVPSEEQTDVLSPETAGAYGEKQNTTVLGRETRSTYGVNSLPALPFAPLLRNELTALPDLSDKLNAPTPPSANEGETGKLKGLGAERSLAVAVSAGFIAGRSGSDPFAMLQPRLGTEIEYRAGKKLAFGSGLYFNEVCYRTDGDNYTAKAGFWTEGVKPEVVQGECRVLEIPLFLKYYFSGSRRNSFYLGTGTTSYLMLKEDYSYEYGADAPADARKGWVENNNNQHLLGIAHANFGFQRSVGKRSFLQLESYVHLPLTGVGHGEVRLMSAGMSAKFLFDFRR